MHKCTKDNISILSLYLQIALVTPSIIIVNSNSSQMKKLFSTSLVFSLFCFMTPSFFTTIIAQTLTDSNLPIIIIDTDFGQTIPDEPKIDGDMKIIYNGEGVRNNVTAPGNEYDGRIGIEMRGSSSQDDSPKKSYSLETRLSNGDNNNVNIFGFGSDNDWILYAPYFDKSMMRNVICYQLARDMNMYATKCKYVEVVVNGEYMGIYVFMEKIKVDDDRVDIKEITPSENTEPGVTGGYIFKKDRPNWKYAAFYTLQNYNGSHRDLLMRHPKSTVSTNEQENWLANYVNEFETKLYADDTTYKDYIKENSFVDHYLLTQASKNIDGFRLSQYFYKDSAERIVAGPPWDYNLTFGKAGYLYGYDYDGWYDGQGDWVGDEPLYWWNKFLDYPHFNDKFAKRWKGLRTGPYKTDRIFTMIDSIDNLLAEAKVRNFTKWDIIPIDDLLSPWHHHEDITWAGVVAYLKDYIRDRFIWIDGQLNTVISDAGIVINEIHYNPDDSLDKKEFIELYNTETNSIDLSGYTFSAGITYTFPNGISIAPDEYIIIAKDALEFSFLTNQVFEWTAGSLDNNGEAVALANNTGACVDYVQYNDKGRWPNKPDGTGPSLELIHPSLDNVIPESWERSDSDEGTPGRTNDEPINKVTNGPQSACNTGTNEYTQELTFEYKTNPGSGTLIVNGQSFPITGSPQTITLTGLNSDSAKVDVTAYFSDDTENPFFKDNSFYAPERCSFLSISESVSMSEMNIYPNPSGGIFMIDLKEFKLGQQTLEVYSSDGKLVKSITINISSSQYVQEIDLSKFAKGAYILQIKNEGNIHMEKLILE